MVTFADYHGTWNVNSSLWPICDGIITGTGFKEAWKVLDDYVGPKRPIFFSFIEPGEYTAIGIANFKADIINKVKARKFYENDKEVLPLLQLLAPDCKIILVSPDKTYI